MGDLLDKLRNLSARMAPCTYTLDSAPAAEDLVVTVCPGAQFH